MTEFCECPGERGNNSGNQKTPDIPSSPIFFHSKAQSSLLLGESHCFQSSLIKHVSKANLVSLIQTPANGLIINLVPFLIANLVSQGLHKGDIRGQAGSQSLFQQSWSKGVSLVSHLIIFYPEFLKELWFPRVVKCKKNKNLIHYFSTFFCWNVFTSQSSCVGNSFKIWRWRLFSDRTNSVLERSKNRQPPQNCPWSL